MFVKICENEKKKYEFIILTSKNEEVYKSSDNFFPFIGDFSDYDKVEDVILAYNKFLFLNKKIIQAQMSSEHGDGAEGIKSSFVAKLYRQFRFYEKMIDKIEEDKKSGKIDRVKNLKGLVDGFSTTVDQFALTFENDERETPIEQQDIEQIGYSQFLSPYSKDVYKLKKKINKFYKKMQEEYPELFEDQDIKQASTENKDDDFYEEWKNYFIYQISESVCDELSNGAFISKIKKTNDGESIVFINDNCGEIILYFNNNMLLHKILPSKKYLSTHPYMSQRFYNEIWKKVLLGAGHIYVNERYLVTPFDMNSINIGYSEDLMSTRDVFPGYDTEKGKSVNVNISYSKKCASHKILNLKISSNYNSLEKKIIDNKKKAEDMIRDNNILKCKNTGTKYDDIAGTVIKDKIKIESDIYYSIPLRIEYDNGVVEEVSFLSENLDPVI